MALDLNDLTPNQLDALKEVGNIGAGHGATALSQLVGKRILITVPQASVIPLKDVPRLVGDPNTLVAGLFLTILGDATGKILLLLPRESAVNLADMLLKQPMGSSKILSEIGHSAIKEAGNILTGAYLSALNEFLGMLLLISVPTLVFDIAGAVLANATLGMEDVDKIVCIETQFIDSNQIISGYFLLMPDNPSLRAIFQAIKLKG
jgi:chemotaxis protein CheC